jgi:hypothetical protein
VKRALAVVALCLLISVSATNAADMMHGHTKRIPQNWQEMFFPGSQDLPNASDTFSKSAVVTI